MKNLKRAFSKRIIPTLLVAALMLTLLPALALAAGPAESVKTLTVATIPDIHVIPQSMWSNSQAAAAALASDRKMFAESAAIFDAALANIVEQAPDVVLLPGDLTKDGEVIAHRYVAEKLTELQEALPDANIYVVPGNHDINNRNAFDYSSGIAVPTPSVTPEQFIEIYDGLGYGDATSEYFEPTTGKAGMLSYAARPADGFTLISIDATKYSADATRSGLDFQETGGNISDELLAWILVQLAEAKERGDTVIAQMHHGIIPHFSMQTTLFADYLVDNFETAGPVLADAGLRYIFTGHMHAQSISKLDTEAGNTLYDIQTGSLVTYPSPVRYTSLTKGINSDRNYFETADTTTTLLKAIDYTDPATGEPITDLTLYGYNNTINAEDASSLVMMLIGGGYLDLDLTSLLGGLLDAEFTNTRGDTYTGSRAFFESMLPTEDADGNPTSNDIGDFLITMMRTTLPNTQSEGIDVMGLIRVFYELNNNRIRMAALGGIGNLYITDANMRTHLVNPTFPQLDDLLADEEYVNALFGRVLAELIHVELYEEYTLFDLARYAYYAFLSGNLGTEPWVDAIMAGFADGSTTDLIADEMVALIMQELNGVLDDIYINTNALITNDLLGGLLKSTVVNALGNTLGALTSAFGIDLFGMLGGDALGGIIDDDMKESLGGLVGEAAASFMTGSGSGVNANNATLSMEIILIKNLRIALSDGTQAAPMVAMPRNGSHQFGLIVDEGASTDGVSWSVSNASLASVDDNGLVTAKGISGNVTLTARDSWGATHSIVLRIA